jgi:hypothetical protein
MFGEVIDEVDEGVSLIEVRSPPSQNRPLGFGRFNLSARYFVKGQV